METRSRRAAATTFLPILAPSIFSPLLVPSFVFFFYWFSRSVEGRWADAIADWVFDFLELVRKM